MKKMVLMGGVLVFFLAACGQKGPLYLPQPAKPAPEATQTSSEPVQPESQKDSTLN